MSDGGTLAPTEWHPAAESARVWFNGVSLSERMLWVESFASCALEGNRTAEICSETLNRIMSGEKVSDRYLLGLVWTMRYGDGGRRHE